MINIREKLTALAMACGLMLFVCLMIQPTQVANLPEAEAALMEEPETVTVFACGNCGEEVNGFHTCGEVQLWHCDSCGEETTDAPQARKFEDGTVGNCCEYCAAFFTLDKADRDAIRASWNN